MRFPLDSMHQNNKRMRQVHQWAPGFKQQKQKLFCTDIVRQQSSQKLQHTCRLDNYVEGFTSARDFSFSGHLKRLKLSYYAAEKNAVTATFLSLVELRQVALIISICLT